MNRPNSRNSDQSVMIKIFNSGYLIALLLFLVSSIGNLCDGLIAAKGLGIAELAAIGLIYPYTKFLECIFLVFSGGSQVVIGRKIGQNRFDEVSGIFCSSLAVLALLGVISTVLVTVFAEPISVFLGASDALETLKPTADYLISIAVGAPAYLMALYMIPLFQLDGADKLINIATTVMTVVNAALNITFLFLDFGIKGIGYSTSVSYFLALLILSTHLLEKKKGILRQGKPTLTNGCLGEVIREGAPSAFKSITSVIYNTAVNKLLASVGSTEALAAFSIFKMTKFVFLSVAEAIINPVRLTQSMLYEEKDRKSMRMIFRYSLRRALLLSAVLAAVLWLFGRPLYSVLVSGTVLDETVSLMNCCGIAIIFNAIVCYYLAYYQAIGKTKTVYSVSAVLNLLSLPLIWLLAGRYGSRGIWAGHAAQYVITAAYCIGCAWFMGRKNRLLIDRLLAHPVEDSVQYEMFDYHISSMEEASAASSEFGLICKEKIRSKRKSYYCSLAFEEIIFNILEYQRSVHAPKTSIDAHIVLFEDGKVIIRIKDDSRERNPFVKYEHAVSEDGLENLGIRMLKSIAEDIKYTYVFGVNYISIRV